jgi:hypothetical protein
LTNYDSDQDADYCPSESSHDSLEYDSEKDEDLIVYEDEHSMVVEGASADECDNVEIIEKDYEHTEESEESEEEVADTELVDEKLSTTSQSLEGEYEKTEALDHATIERSC